MAACSAFEVGMMRNNYERGAGECLVWDGDKH